MAPCWATFWQILSLQVTLALKKSILTYCGKFPISNLEKLKLKCVFEHFLFEIVVEEWIFPLNEKQQQLISRKKMSKKFKRKISNDFKRQLLFFSVCIIIKSENTWCCKGFWNNCWKVNSMKKLSRRNFFAKCIKNYDLSNLVFSVGVKIFFKILL